ncbi:MAG: hypothetical protein JOS17DRAFT_788487 [Linnemannia elongata]|nr:MAG: hypothetical protein JOS17DRAFT_788487 [Linnemannia elongata]
MSHNSIFFGTPRLIDWEDDLYLTDPETTIASFEPPTVLPLTIQDHHDAIQVQLDAAQALTRVLVVAAVMIAVAALVVVAAVYSRRTGSFSNAKNSPLVSLPPEILKLVSSHLTDSRDLPRLDYTCHELSSLTTPAN